MGKPVYHFDRWAEFFTVTLAENIARCSISQSPIQKVRIQLDNQQFWPVGYKAILENGLVIKQAHQKALDNDPAVNAMEYYYRCPTQLPRFKQDADKIAEVFIPAAQKWDDAFYADAWSMKMGDCIPALLLNFAFRSACKLLPQQLKHQGLDISEDFSVQYYDGENFMSYFYDSMADALKRQIGFYLSDERVFNAATELCFKHSENRRWFKSLALSI